MESKGSTVKAMLVFLNIQTTSAVLRDLQSLLHDVQRYNYHFPHSFIAYNEGLYWKDCTLCLSYEAAIQGF